MVSLLGKVLKLRWGLSRGSRSLGHHFKGGRVCYPRPLPIFLSLHPVYHEVNLLVHALPTVRFTIAQKNRAGFSRTKTSDSWATISLSFSSCSVRYIVTVTNNLTNPKAVHNCWMRKKMNSTSFPWSFLIFKVLFPFGGNHCIDRLFSRSRPVRVGHSSCQKGRKWST